MTKMFTPHILCKPEGEGIRWFPIDTTDGRPGLAVFTDATKAEDFLTARAEDAKGTPAEGLEVHKMAFPEFCRWLRYNLTNGTPLMVVDPTPTYGKALEIFRFLAEIEGDAGAAGSMKN